MIASNAFKNIIAQVVGHGLTPAPTGGGTGGGTGGTGGARARARRQSLREFRLRERQLAPGNWRHGRRYTGGCTTPSPGTGYTCVNGNWLPPTTRWRWHDGTCTTARPAANWVCVNGNWLPPWMAPATSPARRQSRRPNFVCVNGNWLPGEHWWRRWHVERDLHHGQARSDMDLQERQLAPALVLSPGERSKRNDREGRMTAALAVFTPRSR